MDIQIKLNAEKTELLREVLAARAPHLSRYVSGPPPWGIPVETAWEIRDIPIDEMIECELQEDYEPTRRGVALDDLAGAINMQIIVAEDRHALASGVGCMTDVALREQDIEALVEVFRRYPRIEQVRLFGSRATGEARRAADIDLAVTAPSMSEAEWAAFALELDEAPLIYHIDAVRLDTLPEGPFKRHILREGVPLYPDDA